MGRIKEQKRQNRKARKRNPVVYIICEGTETEIKYFKHFRTRYCHIDIIPIPSQYKSADKLVQKVKSTLGSNLYYPDEGDLIWCVFGRDDNTNEMLQKANVLAKKLGYRIAYSNPSFELWFLLHFSNQSTALENSQAVIQLLKQKGRLEQYQKATDVYENIIQKQSIAMERAEKLIAKLESEHKEILTRESNPVTTVSKLVRYLNEYRSEEKKEL